MCLYFFDDGFDNLSVLFLNYNSKMVKIFTCLMENSRLKDNI
jgi:hypothetical protein